QGIAPREPSSCRAGSPIEIVSEELLHPFCDGWITKTLICERELRSRCALPSHYGLDRVSDDLGLRTFGSGCHALHLPFELLWQIDGRLNHAIHDTIRQPAIPARRATHPTINSSLQYSSCQGTV